MWPPVNTSQHVTPKDHCIKIEAQSRLCMLHSMLGLSLHYCQYLGWSCHIGAVESEVICIGWQGVLNCEVGDISHIWANSGCVPSWYKSSDHHSGTKSQQNIRIIVVSTPTPHIKLFNTEVDDISGSKGINNLTCCTDSTSGKQRCIKRENLLIGPTTWGGIAEQL